MNDKKDLSAPTFRSENLLIYENDFLSLENEDISSLAPKGNFAKKVLILTDSLESAEQELLDKMIAATGLQLEDIYLLNLAQKRNTWPAIHEWQPEKIICFGNQLDTHASTYSNRLYKIQLVNDYQILNVDFLSNIANNANAKKALWTQLKKMFEL